MCRVCLCVEVSEQATPKSTRACTISQIRLTICVVGWARGGSVRLNSVARLDKRNHAAVGWAAAGAGSDLNVALVGGHTAEARMGPPAILEPEVTAELGPGFRHRCAGLQVRLLVLDALPQPLDEHVVLPTPPPVHADGDAVLLQQVDERLARELAPLVRIEDPQAAPCARALRTVDGRGESRGTLLRLECGPSASRIGAWHESS